MTSYAWQDFLNESQLTCTWLACEVEALAITVATKHFTPYLIQSHHKACMLTDSKPYLQASGAYDRLLKRIKNFAE